MYRSLSTFYKGWQNKKKESIYTNQKKYRKILKFDNNISGLQIQVVPDSTVEGHFFLSETHLAF